MLNCMVVKGRAVHYSLKTLYIQGHRKYQIASPQVQSGPSTFHTTQGSSSIVESEANFYVKGNT